MAKDAAGHLIKAQDAGKDQHYFCPCCDRKLVLKKSGNTAKGSKRAHFAHTGDEPHCSPETILHQLAKQRMAHVLQTKLSEGNTAPFTWACTQCTEEHVGNLLKTAKAIQVEHGLGKIRMDVAIIDEMGRARIAIEIVVSHAPEPEMLAFCEEQSIQVVELHLASNEELDSLEQLLAIPTLVRACRNPICPTCNGRQRTKTLLIAQGRCWRCNSPINVAAIDSEYGVIGPEQFSDEERRIIRQHGVIFKKRFAGSYDKNVWVNACGHCPGFIGPGHLEEQYIDRATAGEYPLQRVTIGHSCTTCNIRREVDDLED